MQQYEKKNPPPTKPKEGSGLAKKFGTVMNEFIIPGFHAIKK